MQWLINEFKAFKAEVFQRVDKAVEDWAKGQVQDAERLTKLENEIKAMKARMGRKTGGE